MLSRSCWARSNCIQHYQGQLTPLLWQRPSWFKGSTQLVVRYSETKTENLVLSLKFEVSVWRLELFQWKLKAILAENFWVSISSFAFSFPEFRKHSYPVLQTSAQSFEVRGHAWTVLTVNCASTLVLLCVPQFYSRNLFAVKLRSHLEDAVWFSKSICFIWLGLTLEGSCSRDFIALEYDRRVSSLTIRKLMENK